MTLELALAWLRAHTAALPALFLVSLLAIAASRTLRAGLAASKPTRFDRGDRHDDGGHP